VPSLHERLGGEAANKGRVEDRITHGGAVTFGLALVAWYAGGSGSFDRLVDGSSLFWACGGLGALGASFALAVQARACKPGHPRAFGNAAFFGVAILFASLMVGALGNRFADSSAVRTHPAAVRGFHHPTKGPKRVTLEAQGQRSTLNAELAEGCVEGDQVIVEVREGALGQPWVSRLRCSRGH
jgi:hypothetical protein